jgi:hypothetical protein
MSVLAISPSPIANAPSYASDYSFGEMNEGQKQARISAFVGKALVRQPRYRVYDYESACKTMRADLKSRRIHSMDHTTALIGMNKVLSADANPDKEHYFFFSYTDGLFYIKYDRAVFEAFNHGDYLRGSREGIVDEPVDTMNIPRNLLLPVPM